MGGSPAHGFFIFLRGEFKVGDRKIVLGNEAIAYGLLEAGCRVAASYPGTPASEILGTILRIKEEKDLGFVHAEWSVNEKVAFETALAASYTGLRSAVMMKQVGLNVASDSLMSAAYTGVKGGFLIISADDPGPHSSQTEQDSRFFAMFAKIPVFDPSSPEEAKGIISKAFELSERYEIPVMVRPTTRICHSRQDMKLGEIIKGGSIPSFDKNPARWAATPKFRYLLHKELNGKLKKISLENMEDIINLSHIKDKCIVASGVAWSNVKEIFEDLQISEDVSLIKVIKPYPLSKSLIETIKNSKEVLVLEETYPVIEYQLRGIVSVSGRLDGTVPSAGELLPEVVEEVVRKWLGLPEPDRLTPEDVVPRRPTLCPGCAHRPVFFAIRKVFKKKGIYPGDIGCYTLGINLDAVDTVLCMGASVAQASGFFHAFKMGNPDQEIPPVVATIGDSTFFHAGIPPLINAVVHKARFILVILDNSTTAMTGHQPVPHKMGNSEISIEKLVEACGVKYVKVVDPYNLKGLIETLKDAGKYAFDDEKGVAVVIARRPCIMDRSARDSFEKVRVYVTDECNGCLLCVQRFECPAILATKPKEPVTIDEVLCTGCGVCVDVCPYGAIGVKK